MKNILIVSTVEFSRNGISTYILNLCKHISTNDIKIDLIVPNYVTDDIKTCLLKNQITLYEIPNRKTNVVLYFIKVLKLILRKEYSAIHVHGNSSIMLIELFAALIGGINLRIAHSHNTTCNHKIVHKILLPMFNMCCKECLACGEEAGRWLFNKRDFKVVENGIIISDYKPNIYQRQNIRKKLYIGNDTLVLGHVGMFNFQKNQEFFLSIINELIKTKLKFKLILVGDGPNKKEFENMIEDSVKDRIICTGNVDNVFDYYQAFDLFLLPSRFEGMPFVLVEAQAAGLQCIVSNRISSEINLTKSIKFITIENPVLWVDIINNNLEEAMWEKRCQNHIQWRPYLIEKGYDISQSSEYIKDLYLK